MPLLPQLPSVLTQSSAFPIVRAPHFMDAQSYRSDTIICSVLDITTIRHTILNKKIYIFVCLLVKMHLILMCALHSGAGARSSPQSNPNSSNNPQLTVHHRPPLVRIKKHAFSILCTKQM